jgi:hypothetical protein
LTDTCVAITNQSASCLSAVHPKELNWTSPQETLSTLDKFIVLKENKAHMVFSFENKNVSFVESWDRLTNYLAAFSLDFTNYLWWAQCMAIFKQWLCGIDGPLCRVCFPFVWIGDFACLWMLVNKSLKGLACSACSVLQVVPSFLDLCLLQRRFFPAKMNVL